MQNFNRYKNRYGYVMSVQRYSVNDGDGIRSTIFLAGCPLRCVWCSNPEGQTRINSMTQRMSVQDVVDQISKDEMFFRFSGGGVTFSGGEATAQPEFLQILTDIFYDRGYDLAVETCGYFDFERMRPVLEKMNRVFIDLKLLDSEKHLRYTGADNHLILENMIRIAESEIPAVVRIPVINGVNGSDDEMKKAFLFIREKAEKVQLELLPYHRYGEAKYLKLKRPLPPAEFSIPSDEQMRHLKKLAEEIGIRVVSFR